MAIKTLVLRRKIRIFAALYALLTCVLLAISVFAEQSSPEQSIKIVPYFELNWPSELTKQTLSHPAAKLLLKPNGSDYPSFNIIEIPGHLPREPIATTVLNSYKSIGITTAEVRNIQTARTDTVEIVYSSNGENLRSSVTLIDGGPEHYYVLTYIDRQNDFETHRSILENIFSGLKIHNNAPEGGNVTTFPPVWLVVLLVAVLCFFIVHKFRFCNKA